MQSATISYEAVNICPIRINQNQHYVTTVLRCRQHQSVLSGNTNMNKTVLFCAIASVTLVACSETPYIDMCQKVTGNLVGSVSEWSDSSKSEQGDALFVKVAYATAGGNSGNATCKYIESSSGGYVTSPHAVSVNGQDVPQKQVMVATLKSTKTSFQEAAVETKEQTTKLASEASEKATELAGEATEKASELAGKAQEKASELAGQAASMAETAKEKAREAALDATKTVQDKLEN
jgi:hypothetical protein